MELYKYNFKDLDEVKPDKYGAEGTGFFLFIFSEILIKSYLKSFSVIYVSLKNFKEGVKSNHKLRFLVIYIFNLTVKLVTGLSKNVIKNSFKWSLKFWCFGKTVSMSVIFFNIVIDSFVEYNQIEKMRIYKTKYKKYNFNPPKEFDYVLEIIFNCRNNKELLDKGAKILLDSPINECIKVFESTRIYQDVKIGDSKPHPTNLYYVFNKPDFIVAYNQTSSKYIPIAGSKSKEETTAEFNFKGMLDPKYYTKPYGVKKEHISVIDRVYKIDEPRSIAEWVKLNSIYGFFALMLFRDDYLLVTSEEGLISVPADKKFSFLNQAMKYFEKEARIQGKDIKMNYEVNRANEEMAKFYEKKFKYLTREEQIATFLRAAEWYDINCINYLDKLAVKYVSEKPKKSVIITNLDDIDKFY